MASNNNGFADALKQTKTLLSVNEKVVLDVLEEAADYFAERLKPNIPERSGITIESLKVVVKGDMVQVVFGQDAWYWYLVEHGHKKRGRRGKVKGRHFVRNTWDAESNKIEEIMLGKIIEKMEG